MVAYMKGQGSPQAPGWGNPRPSKGKGKGNKGSWNLGKGAWGKGGKGAYGLEDDWSEGYSGYAYGFYGDIEALSLSQAAIKEWQTPSPRTTLKPTRTSIRSVESRECGWGCCNNLSTRRFDALSEGSGSCDLDIPMMVVLDAGDVPQASVYDHSYRISASEVPVISTSVPESEYPQDWMKEKVKNIIEKNVKAHDKPANQSPRLASLRPKADVKPTRDSSPGGGSEAEAAASVTTDPKEVLKRFVTRFGPALKPEVKHFSLGTPPISPPREVTSPPGLGTREYPILSPKVPPRHEEKVIAQSNRNSTIKRNMRSIFGQEFALTSSVIVAEAAVKPTRDSCPGGESKAEADKECLYSTSGCTAQRWLKRCLQSTCGCTARRWPKDRWPSVLRLGGALRRLAP